MKSPFEDYYHHIITKITGTIDIYDDKITRSLFFDVRLYSNGASGRQQIAIFNQELANKVYNFYNAYQYWFLPGVWAEKTNTTKSIFFQNVSNALTIYFDTGMTGTIHVQFTIKY